MEIRIGDGMRKDAEIRLWPEGEEALARHLAELRAIDTDWLELAVVDADDKVGGPQVAVMVGDHANGTVQVWHAPLVVLQGAIVAACRLLDR